MEEKFANRNWKLRETGCRRKNLVVPYSFSILAQNREMVRISTHATALNLFQSPGDKKPHTGNSLRDA